MLNPDLTPRRGFIMSPVEGGVDKLRRSVLLASAVLGPSLLQACSSAPKPPAVTAPGALPAPPPVMLPTVISATLSAAANLNPSVTQRPSPLLMRLYELRTMAAFGKADFMALYQGDIAVLGNELVVRDEFVLQPGESRPYPRTLAPDTRFIGLLGIFRDIERAVWRASVAVQPGRPLKLAIRADALAVSMTVTP